MNKISENIVSYNNKKKISKPKDVAVGFEPRRAAIQIVKDILNKRAGDDTGYSAKTKQILANLPHRDARFATTIADFALRRKAENDFLLNQVMEKGVPEDAGDFYPIMLTATAQIAHMKVSTHAAVHQAVDLIKADKRAGKLQGLSNACLRKISRIVSKYKEKTGEAEWRPDDAIFVENIPKWLRQRWQSAYGREALEQIAALHRNPPLLDLTINGDPLAWADKLEGLALNPKTVRLFEPQPVSQIQGYEEGAWWVQDYAASLPVQLFGEDLSGKVILDACAAPGGKTAQLIALGATVVSVDRSKNRLTILKENLNRLKMDAEVIALDLMDENQIKAKLSHYEFDGILLDAPCSATGTFRRHLDIGYLKSERDIKTLSTRQAILLKNLSSLLKSGGVMVYATCSLETEEGESQISHFLEENEDFTLDVLCPSQFSFLSKQMVNEGMLRALPNTMPSQLDKSDEDELNQNIGGMDGFFAAKLKKL